MLNKSLPGDIYLTRNIPELNEIPSYWQHAAISNGVEIIEGRREFGMVVKTSEIDFLARNPEIILLRPKNQEFGSLAAKCAEEYLGTLYSRMLFNCVTLVRKVYAKATNDDPLWIFPDSIYKSELFYTVEHFK